VQCILLKLQVSIHTNLFALQLSAHTLLSSLFASFKTLYNEERRLGVQRGSDTLVVPLITSNDGLSIAY